MSLIENITRENLEKMLGREVPPAHVLIAKNQLFGAGPEIIAELLGANKDEISEIIESQEYKDVFTLVSSQHNETNLDATLTWDSVEAHALSNVSKFMERNRGDIEMNLRVAAIANKAVRRQTPLDSALDPRRAGDKVSIVLTSRVLERLTNQTAERTTTRQVSISGGHTNPTFEEVQHLLSPKEEIDTTGYFDSEPTEDESADVTSQMILDTIVGRLTRQ